MRSLSVVVCSICLAFGLGCRKQDKESVLTEFRVEPAVSNFLPNEVFCSVEEVRKVDGLDVGRVIVQRKSDGHYFAVMVIPMRQIPPDSVVRIIEIDYLHNSWGVRKSFFVIQ